MYWPFIFEQLIDGFDNSLLFDMIAPEKEEKN